MCSILYTGKMDSSTKQNQKNTNWVILYLLQRGRTLSVSECAIHLKFKVI